MLSLSRLERLRVADSAPTAPVSLLPKPRAPKRCPAPESPHARRHRRKSEPNPDEKRAVRVGFESRDKLYAVACEMASSLHYPWRVWGTWPAQLRQVAHTWLRGELAPARNAGRMTFRELLQTLPLEPGAEHEAADMADFLLLWGNTMHKAARQADCLDGGEAIDALEAVACHIVVLHRRFAAWLPGNTQRKLTQVASKLLHAARELSGCYRTGTAPVK